MLFGLVRQGLKCEGEYTGTAVTSAADGLVGKLNRRLSCYKAKAGFTVGVEDVKNASVSVVLASSCQMSRN